MREIREEQAHEKRQLLKRAEIDREDLETRFQRLSREAEGMRQLLQERDGYIEDLSCQLDQERQQNEQLRQEFEAVLAAERERWQSTIETIREETLQSIEYLRSEAACAREEVESMYRVAIPQIINETKRSIMKAIKDTDERAKGKFQQHLEAQREAYRSLEVENSQLLHAINELKGTMSQESKHQEEEMQRFAEIVR